jgi:molecular chaperone GrpE
MDDKKPKKQKSREVEELRTRVIELEDQLKRAVADYRNLENRVSIEKQDFVKYANKNLVEQLLPAFDTVLLAEKYTDDQNFKITVKHILDVLKNAGIERVETVGKDYNPETMEAIEIVEGEKEKVVDETQPGFVLYGKVIRPARVKVGGKEKENV